MSPSFVCRWNRQNPTNSGCSPFPPTITLIVHHMMVAESLLQFGHLWALSGGELKNTESATLCLSQPSVVFANNGRSNSLGQASFSFNSQMKGLPNGYKYLFLNSHNIMCKNAFASPTFATSTSISPTLVYAPATHSEPAHHQASKAQSKGFLGIPPGLFTMQR